MPHLSGAQLQRIAARAGHDQLEVFGHPGNFRIRCSCGYQSTRRRTEALAAQAGIHHVHQVVQQIDGLVTMSGVPLNRAIERVRVTNFPAPPAAQNDADTPPAAVAG
jgi:hypothetical protein